MTADPPGITPELRGAIKSFGGIKPLKKAWEHFSTLLTARSKRPDETEGKLNGFLRLAAVYLHDSVPELLPHREHRDLWNHPDERLTGVPRNPMLRVLALGPDAYSKGRGLTPYPVVDEDTVGGVSLNRDELTFAHKLAEAILDRLRVLETHLLVDEVLEALTPREKQILAAPGLLELKDFTRTSLAQTLSTAAQKDERFGPEARVDWSDAGVKKVLIRLKSEELGIAQASGQGRGTRTNWTGIGRQVIAKLRGAL